MPFPNWSVAAVLALLPLAATAQQPQQADPANPDAPVPAMGYVSAFSNYSTLADEQISPEKAWRAANEEVQGKDGHSGHMLMSGTGAESHAPKAETPQPDAHAGHGSHHNQGSNNAH